MELVPRAVLEGVGYTIESYVAAELAQRRLMPLLTDWSPPHQSYHLY
jgi:DNA-binding transcriptional LysR family regulator